MAKILLIYDDYTELNAVQFTLKKVGFDCLGISTEFGTNQQVISFNPDIVVASGRGPKVSTVGVGRRLKEMPRWTGKAVLIFPAGHKPNPEELIKIRMDVVLEAPVETVRLIQVLAKLTHQDDQVLIEKLIKTMAQENTAKDPSFIVGGKPTSESVYVGGSSGENKSSVAVGSRSAERNSDSDLSFKVLQGSSETTAVARRGAFEIPQTEKPPQERDPSFANAAFEDLNRREEARARRRPQFSLKPESEFDGSLKNDKLSLSDFEKKAEAQIREQQKIQLEKQTGAGDRPDLPIDKQEVNWSELENQLFPQKSAQQSSLPAAVTGFQESVPQSINASAGASETATTTQFPMAPSDVPASIPSQFDFEQQVRHAEGGLAHKMKNYQEMSRSLKLNKESTLKKTNSRKAQIELMKDWKQVELDKQDSLRREFTKALFKKK